MSEPLLVTKFYLPSTRSQLVTRPQLLEKLDGGIDRKLTLVSASAGFGKTTLISEWILQNERPVSWLSLDDGDNDPRRFLTYFITGLRRIGKNVGDDILEALESHQLPSLEPLLINLINEIAEELPSFIFVLDDYHTIDEPVVHEIVTFLLDNQPPQMHIVISTRADPPWVLSKLRAGGEMIELRVTDLRFTEEEVVTFLNDVMGLSLTAEEIATLNSRTEGWIAGLQMAALSIRGREDASGFIRSFAGSHRFILDYLLEEVLSSQSSQIQDFLLKTSILERLVGALCDSVTGQDGGQEILAQLDQSNLFVVPLDDERCWYRYHHLFAELLKSRLEQTMADQISALHMRASEWYENEGYLDDAITHAYSGGDVDRAADLVERNAVDMLADSKLTALSRWLSMIPDKIIRARPWLCVYQGWVRYWMGDRDQVEECLERAEIALQKQSDNSHGQGSEKSPSVLTEAEKRHIAGHIAAVRSYNAVTNEQIPSVLELAQKAVELLPEGDYMRGTTSITLGCSYWGQGDVVSAERAFLQARDIAKESGFRSLVISSTCYMGIQQVKQGRLFQARDTFLEAIEVAKTPGGRTLLAAGFAEVELSGIYFEWNDLTNAEMYLLMGIDRCRKFGNVDFLVNGLVRQANLRLVKGDHQGASRTHREAARLAEKGKVDPWIVCALDESRLRYWIAEGNLPAAVQWAEKSGLLIDGELNYLHDLDHLNLARVMVAQGLQEPSSSYLDQAIVLLERLLAAAEKAKWVHEMIKILILQSQALMGRNQEDGAITALERALVFAEPGGYVRSIVCEGEWSTHLLRKLAVEGTRVDYVNGLLDAIESKPRDDHKKTDFRTTAQRISPLVDPLSERELQILRLLMTDLSIPDIAAELFIAVSTVRSHIKNIYSKLGVHSRFEAVARTREMNLI